MEFETSIFTQENRNNNATDNFLQKLVHQFWLKKLKLGRKRRKHKRVKEKLFLSQRKLTPLGNKRKLNSKIRPNNGMKKCNIESHFSD